jgi:hypothetical protein
MKGSISIVKVMKKWVTIVSNLKIIAHNTILVADSYYLDQTGHYFLDELEVYYLCAVQACHFSRLVEIAKEHCKKPGKTTILHNEDSNETFIQFWYPDGHLN